MLFVRMYCNAIIHRFVWKLLKAPRKIGKSYYFLLLLLLLLLIPPPPPPPHLALRASSVQLQHLVSHTALGQHYVNGFKVYDGKDEESGKEEEEEEEEED